MRLEELKLRMGSDELRVGFHDRLTVVGGVGPEDRRGFVELVVNALAATGDDATELSLIDATGQRMLITHDGNGRVSRTYDDGTPAPDVLERLGIDADAMRALCYIRAADVENTDGAAAPELPPEVAEAHAALAAVDAELADAQDRRDRVTALEAEIVTVKEQLGRIDDLMARRRYAELLVQLERVRAEAEALRGGERGAEADELLAAAAREIRPLARRWRKIADLLAHARATFGDRDRLDADTLHRALAAPERIPPDLDALALRVDHAERERDGVAARLALLAVDQLPTPSHPAVVRLARADQETVWTTCRHAAEARELLEQASIDMGGVDAAGPEAAIVSEIEATHEVVERASATVQAKKRKGVIGTGIAGAVGVAGGLLVPVAGAVGLLTVVAVVAWAFIIPKLALSKAAVAENAVLARAGVSSYLAFHIRRIDATIDPAIRERLVQTMLTHHHAIESWQALAGELTPAEALLLEPEVHEYAAALYGLEGAVEEIESLQHQLTAVAEPELESARAALLAACAPFGVDDAFTAVDTARRVAALSETARLQAALEELEEDETTLRDKLVARLGAAGFATDGSADTTATTALADFEAAAAAAEERIRARVTSRPADEVHADLDRLEEQARRDKRPEWGDAEIETDAPDEGELVARRDALNAERIAAERDMPDIARLRDRRNALARRISVLEEDAGIVTAPVGRADIEPKLVARLVGCRRTGSAEETLVAFFDEPFVNAASADKWVLLDLVERQAADVQAVLLTDDPDVVVWARRRAGAGAITLLEPVAEPV